MFLNVWDLIAFWCSCLDSVLRFICLFWWSRHIEEEVYVVVHRVLWQSFPSRLKNVLLGEFWICFHWLPYNNWEPFLFSLLALDLLCQNLNISSFRHNILILRFSDGEIRMVLDYVTLEPPEFVFSFSDLTAAHVYHLLKRSISDSINPEDSTFPGQYKTPLFSDAAFVLQMNLISLITWVYKKYLLIVYKSLE